MRHPSLPVKFDCSFIVRFKQVLTVVLTTRHTISSVAVRSVQLTTHHTVSSVAVRSVQLYEGVPSLEPVVIVLSYRRQRIWEVITVIRI